MIRETPFVEFKLDKTPLAGDLDELGLRVGIVKVCNTKWEPLWDKLMEERHPLGVVKPLSNRLKYLITLGNKVAGALSFRPGAARLGPRDALFGWDDEARLKMKPGLVFNDRFLIFPWIKVPKLASQALTLSLERLKNDWRWKTGSDILLAEALVPSESLHGNIYAESGWRHLGYVKRFISMTGEAPGRQPPNEVYIMILCPNLAKVAPPEDSRAKAEKDGLVAMLSDAPAHWAPVLKSMGLSGLLLESLPEKLVDHLSPYFSFLSRLELRGHFVTLLAGLLSDLSRKTLEPIALSIGAKKGVRNVQNFITEGMWDDQKMLRRYQNETLLFLADENAMLTVDTCDFPKQGKMSAGVVRQYCGFVGKRRNCQSSVMLGVCGEKGCALIDGQLFIPQEWFGASYAEKRDKCRFPPDLTFQAKTQMASDKIKALAEGPFGLKYLGLGPEFSDWPFLQSLPQSLVYFADAPGDRLVFPILGQTAQPGDPGESPKPGIPLSYDLPVTVKDLVAGHSGPWAKAMLPIGPGLSVEALDKVLRVVESKDGQRSNELWLYSRKLDDGSIRYSLCSESAEADPDSLRKLAAMRLNMEGCFKECRDYLGLDHYEVRSYRSWHRHVLLVWLAHWFVTKLRLRL